MQMLSCTKEAGSSALGGWVVSKAAELKKNGFEMLPLALATRSDFGVSGGVGGQTPGCIPPP